LAWGPDADRHAKLLIHPAVEGLAGVGVLVNGRFAPEPDVPSESAFDPDRSFALRRCQPLCRARRGLQLSFNYLG
jgi:hypothetical protein